MRTALVLLLMLAIGSVVGTLVPQIPNSPERVARFIADHPLLGDFYRHAGFFDVFGSWWFVLVTTLLFLSLVMCLLPRTRAAIRNVRQAPLHAREIDSFRHYEERAVAAAPEGALDASRRVLRRRLYRVSRSDGALAAEKGALREVGSLLFHWSFLLLVAGVIYGKGTGFTGKAVVVEGQTWTDGAANYEGTVRPGRFFDGNYTGVGVHLVSFTDTYRRTGEPMDFVSQVELLDPGGTQAGSADIRVNHPAEFDGLRLFQYGFGWAPVVEVRRGERSLFAGPIPFAQAEPTPGVPELALPWSGVVKVPFVGKGLGVQLTLWPDSGAYVESRMTGRPVPMTGADHPFMFFTSWQGPIVDPSPRSLGTAGMRRWSTGTVGRGRTCDLGTGRCWEEGTRKVRAGDLTISFPSLRQYSVLQVTRDAGVPLVLAAAILVLVGLLPALYTSRRKVWVRAESNGKGTILKVGGFALQRKVQFEEEFSKIVDELQRVSAEGLRT
jgi:cytochrome c biogenesis protein